MKKYILCFLLLVLSFPAYSFNIDIKKKSAEDLRIRTKGFPKYVKQKNYQMADIYMLSIRILYHINKYSHLYDEHLINNIYKIAHDKHGFDKASFDRISESYSRLNVHTKEYIAYNDSIKTAWDRLRRDLENYSFKHNGQLPKAIDIKNIFH